METTPIPTPESTGLPQGFDYHVAAEQAIRGPLDAAAQAEAIEQRRLSPEVQQLNNIAQSEIWGTRGRTTGYLDPSTGQPLAEPIEGKLEEMRQDPGNGQGSAERDEKAAAYEQGIHDLMNNDDLELTQAKLIMDGRENDQTLSAQAIAKRVLNGESATEAEDKVHKMYAKKDAWRLKRVKEGGIFSAEELNGSRGGDGDNDPTQVMDTPEQAENDRKNEVAHAHLTEFTDKARAEYVRLTTGRAKRGFRIGKEFSKDAIAEARQRYEKQKSQLLLTEVSIGREAGMGEEALDKHITASAIREAEKLSLESFNERRLATGRWELKDIHDPATGITRRRIVEIVPPSTGRGSIKKAFLSWWGEKEGDKLLSKPNLKLLAKRAAIVGAAPAAVVAGAVSPPLMLGVAGAFTANRAAGGIANIKPGSRRKRNEGWIFDGYEDMKAVVADQALKEGDPLAAAGDMIDGQTEEQVSKNRRAAAIRLGATAVGGIAGVTGGVLLQR